MSEVQEIDEVVNCPNCGQKIPTYGEIFPGWENMNEGQRFDLLMERQEEGSPDCPNCGWDSAEPDDDE